MATAIVLHLSTSWNVWLCLLPCIFLHLPLQCMPWNKVLFVWKLHQSCSVFETIVCCTRFLSAKFGHSDCIILISKAKLDCPNCHDFIASSYLNASSGLKVHINGSTLLLWHSLCPLLQTSTPHLTPVLMPYSTHLDQNHFLMMEMVAWKIPLSNGKTENCLLEVWCWGNASHFRPRPFVTGSYIKY